MMSQDLPTNDYSVDEFNAMLASVMKAAMPEEATGLDEVTDDYEAGANDGETAPEPEPTLTEDLAALDALERHLYAHRFASLELEAFGETIEPPDAAADRAEALAILQEEDQERLSDPAVAALLGRLTKRSGELKNIRKAQVRVLKRDRDKLCSVDAAANTKLSLLQSESYGVWCKAKAEDNWFIFAPYLDSLVEQKRKIALAMRPDSDPYDTMLDWYEHGADRAFYDNFFAQVKQTVVPLLSSIRLAKRQVSRACVEGRFDEGRQWELARDVARLEGINENAHFLTSTEHPFSEAMSSHFAVTAGHVHEDNLMANVYSILHEVGHNLYEQGVDPKLNRTSLKGGTSMGIHESQSRFFEDSIGRDRAFMDPLLALMKKRFPGQLGRVTANQLYNAVNRVEPSLIRIQADELTYPLHIMVRYEIEQLLISGEIAARDVPFIWADRYGAYLDVNVPNNTQGALQDVHWAFGDFGYFPTYALGGAYAAQFRHQIIADGIDWAGQLSRGDLAPIRAWLGSHIWRFGRAKDPAEILEYACGEPFNPSYYADYLNKKYTAIYGLR